jgi:uncharacterized membrane protein
LPANPEPRRAWRAWLAAERVSAGLAVLGVAVATYLTIIHYRSELLVCGAGDCASVQQSSYAEIAGIPVAAFGLAMYLTVFALAIVRWFYPPAHELATIVAFALMLSGALYAAYLTYVELWVINAICQWCVISALITLGLLVSEGRIIIRLLRNA